MSNQQVGNVFDRVIQDVCDASQIDFEESGVDQTTLLDLRQSWQKKLSSLGVAHFPWDPTPQQSTAPQPQHQSQNQTQNQIRPPITTVPSNVPSTTRPQAQHVPASSFSQSLPQSVPAAPAPMQAPVATSMANDVGQPRIKQEPGLNGQSPAMSNIAPPHQTNNQLARERAANMLHQRYGAAAANSVSQLQAQPQGPMAMPPQPNNMQSPNGQGGTIKTEPGYSPISQPSVGNAQTDGADDALSDWKAEVARRRAAAESQNGESDRILRDHLKQRMNQLEGGGLLIPLEERQAPSRDITSELGLASSLSADISSTAEMPRAQFDGPGGDDTKEEDDEDAINSDLDDPDDLVGEDNEGEDSVGQIMLCTYDKVQRVKNKWKCTLKDGVLTTGGKEYVFHKGQGEFEW